MNRDQFQSIDPVSGEQLETFPENSPAEIEQYLQHSEQAFHNWKSTAYQTRTGCLLNLARELRSRKVELATTIALEMGKPLHEGAGEIEKCAWVCEHYARHAPDYLESRSIATEATRSQVHFQPLGPVLAIMPWNFPYWQFFRFAAPALMAGNSILLKHAPNVQGCARHIRDLFQQADLPAGLLINLRIPVSRIADLLADPRVAAATLTGSTQAGRSLAQMAGKNLKKVVLELGGSDPYLILHDADIQLAARKSTIGRLLNNGQSCIAAKRLIVDASIADDFTAALIEFCRKYACINPLSGQFITEANLNQHAKDLPEQLESNPDFYGLGPMARQDLQIMLHKQVQDSISKGAQLLQGGIIPELPGYYYPPTILSNVQPGMSAFDQESFGPLFAIIIAENESHAIALANQSSYGLGSAIFSQDEARAYQIGLEQLQAGACFINDFVKSDPRLPFGGIRESGLGRELGLEGIREFVNVKTMQIA